MLANSLNHLAAFHVHSGDFARAAVMIDEVDAIAQATGLPPMKYSRSKLIAARGDRVQMQGILRIVMENAGSRGEGSAFDLYWCLSALMHNGHSEYDKAFTAARQACEDEGVITYGSALVELVEAAVRIGSVDEGATALDRLSVRTQACGTEWALGVEARCRGLLSDDEESYRESTERLARSRGALELARSQLCYGEWLRRVNRRADAREYLRAAHESFSQMGADAFAERARRELLATGETVRKRAGDNLKVLTPQELQTAMMARDGYTNTEIGARLFISARTVEYHLHKVFRKLGVAGRRDLRDAFVEGSH